MCADTENAENECQKLDRSTLVIFGPFCPALAMLILFLYGELSGVTGHPNGRKEEANAARCRPIAKAGSEVAEIHEKDAASPDT